MFHIVSFINPRCSRPRLPYLIQMKGQAGRLAIELSRSNFIVMLIILGKLQRSIPVYYDPNTIEFLDSYCYIS
jgi:hypothetical protein